MCGLGIDMILQLHGLTSSNFWYDSESAEFSISTSGKWPVQSRIRARAFSEILIRKAENGENITVSLTENPRNRLKRIVNGTVRVSVKWSH
ncbi:MAG: hypothetical protein D6732_21135 [Methanobacteriota archaeon]|nr:MAG: hypothetical protein D6732_21135 [Euryarchaeota archaeon]